MAVYRVRWILLLLAACSPAGVRTPEPAAPALAWGGGGPDLRYEIADSSTILMSIPGMGDAPVDLAARTTLDLAFRGAGDALGVTATVADIEGRFASPAGAPTIVGTDDRPPPATLRVAPDGTVDLTAVPSFEGELAQVASPAGLYRALFPLLPGGPAEPGATWTDTLRVSENQTGMTSTTTQVVRSTWTGDTLVDGRRLLVIESSTTSDIRIEGTTQGIAIEQQLTGTSSGVSLWDPELGRLVERHETGTASGSADLPGLNMTGIPLTARSRQHIRLLRR